MLNQHKSGTFRNSVYFASYAVLQENELGGWAMAHLIFIISSIIIYAVSKMCDLEVKDNTSIALAILAAADAILLLKGW